MGAERCELVGGPKDGDMLILGDALEELRIGVWSTPTYVPDSHARELWEWRDWLTLVYVRTERRTADGRRVYEFRK